MTHPLTELTEQMIQDALDAVDTNRPPSLVIFDETGPWTEYEREELRKFSELTKDISFVSSERRERIEQRKSELRPQEES